jgi:hypothetical protein
MPICARSWDESGAIDGGLSTGVPARDQLVACGQKGCCRQSPWTGEMQAAISRSARSIHKTARSWIKAAHDLLAPHHFDKKMRGGRSTMLTGFAHIYE